jgi:hypothetical protein
MVCPGRLRPSPCSSRRTSSFRCRRFGRATGRPPAQPSAGRPVAGLHAARVTLSALAEDLASHGYVVVGIDHTYDPMPRLAAEPVIEAGLDDWLGDPIDQQDGHLVRYAGRSQAPGRTAASRAPSTPSWARITVPDG